jgi:3-hydroxyisobutyrate dehydrogenase-like beta-hydroxyacid dehydrogenase
MKVAFIGLGVMGYPMAGHLASAGHDVTVYNRTSSKVESWKGQYQGQVASTPAEAVKDADFIFACVGNDDHLREITLGENGAFSACRQGSVFVDHTSASANIAEELYRKSSSKGFSFLDAPVSGGQVGAEKGTLTIMVGGDQAAYDRAEPLMRVYGKSISLMGGAGSGQLTKMVNQICIAGIVQSLAEGLNFAESVGLDGMAVVDVISKGAAQSWQMEQRSATMLKGEYNFGFAVDWMRKDLANAIAQAKLCEAPVPLTELVDTFYADVQAMGGNRWDTSSLLARLKAQKTNQCG